MPSVSDEASPSHSSDRAEKKERSNLIDINAQLQAQGITKAALKLDGLSSKHRDNVVRILLGLLQKRTEDLDRTDTIATAHRVLSYDHDRLCGMHKKLKVRVIAAEKEREAAKAQMTDLTSKLKREQAAHKITKDEMQKARNALTSVRTQAQHDAKKRDVQLERTLQQWQRLSNENARVSTASSRGGMLLLNPIDPIRQLPRADSFWDPAINELNTTIINLQEECEAFRHVTLSTANQLQAVLATASDEPEPARLSPSTFFNASQSVNSSQLSSSTSHPVAADTRLRELVTKLKNRIEAEVTEKRETARLYQSELDLETLEGERVERVKELMKSRMEDVERQLTNARHAAKEAQDLVLEYAKASGKPAPILRFAQEVEPDKDTAAASIPAAEQPTVEAVPSAITDEKKDQLEADKQIVELERKRMTEGLVRLAQERAVFEAERSAYLEDKRARELEELLREPTRRSPEPSPSSSTSPTPSETPEPSQSSSAPPSTPSRRSGSSSSESSREESVSYPPTSAHRLLTPPRLSHASKSMPSVSSPLAGGVRRSEMSPSKASSPALKKRARKGPATPLARYVSHKIVAEKLASAKKARKLHFEAEEQHQEEEEVGADDPVSGESNTSRPVDAKQVEAPALVGKKTSALTASTRDNALIRSRPTLLTSKDRLSALKTTTARPRAVSPSKAGSRTTPAGRSYLTSTASSAHKEGLIKSETVIKKLQVGQASGMGPALARRNASFR